MPKLLDSKLIYPPERNYSPGRLGSNITSSLKVIPPIQLTLFGRDVPTPFLSQANLALKKSVANLCRLDSRAETGMSTPSRVTELYTKLSHSLFFPFIADQ